MKQLIIASQDLDPETMAAQIAYAASAFLVEMIRDSWPEEREGFYHVNYRLDKNLYNNWIDAEQPKEIQYIERESFKHIAKKVYDLGMIKEVDFFSFGDAQGMACMGFRPMEDEELDELEKDLYLH